jgi:hypothetical protein
MRITLIKGKILSIFCQYSSRRWKSSGAQLRIIESHSIWCVFELVSQTTKAAEKESRLFCFNDDDVSLFLIQVRHLHPLYGEVWSSPIAIFFLQP